VGDTNVPTATPIAPTSVPTSEPTPALTFGLTSSWNQLSNNCGTSACDTANGGCTITLSDDFVMGSYIGETSFSGKTIVIWGQGRVLDALGGGRFFVSESVGSFLELHDAVLQNGDGENVSGRSASRHAVVELF
jgi:hypothetical protein